MINLERSKLKQPPGDEIAKVKNMRMWVYTKEKFSRRWETGTW